MNLDWWNWCDQGFQNYGNQWFAVILCVVDGIFLIWIRLCTASGRHAWKGRHSTSIEMLMDDWDAIATC
jgi:hypothetical protein